MQLHEMSMEFTSILQIFSGMKFTFLAVKLMKLMTHEVLAL